MQIKRYIPYLLFVLIVIFFSTTYYHEMIFMMPQGIHDWAQADRYSLAVSFYDRGMNFFKPATHNLYAQDGITGVEFPIQAYLAAIGGKIFGREYISICFRTIDTIINGISLLFLFHIVYRETKNFLISLLPPMFLFCAPVYIYYTCNYLPDATATAIAIISFYYVYNYIKSNNDRSFIIGVIILTIASLIKTSAAVYLIGFLGYGFIVRVRNKHGLKSNIKVVITTVLCLGSIAFYYFYNRYLNEYYHSGLFLAETKPIENKEQFDKIIFRMKELWLEEYFIKAQYLVYIVCIFAGIPYLISSKHGKSLLFQAAIFFIGALSVGYLMGSQFFEHDYYVLAIFFPFIIFTLTISTIAFAKNIPDGKQNWSLQLGTLGAVLIMFFFADYHIYRRIHPPYEPFYHSNPWAQGGDSVLKSLGIPQTEHILVLNDLAPNISLTYFDRRGYHAPPGHWQSLRDIEEFLCAFDMKIVVNHADVINDFNFNNDSTFQNDFKILYNNDTMSIMMMKASCP